MLVLSRKNDESILIDGNIRITVLGIRGGQVRLGIEAPRSVRVVREELKPFPNDTDHDGLELIDVTDVTDFSADHPAIAHRLHRSIPR